MNRLLWCAVVVLGVSLGGPAFGYEYLCGGWEVTGDNGYCPTGTLRQDRECGPCNASNAPKWASGAFSVKAEYQGGNGISAGQFTQAVQSAAAQWTQVSCSSLLVSYNGTLAATSSARWGSYNNRNSEHGVFFVTSPQEWMEVTGSGAGNTLGVTVSPYSDWNCTREIADTDILINGFIDRGWSLGTVQGTILHEMGHSLGLGHPCLTTDAYCPNSCTAVMSATGGDFNIPQQDDVNAVCALYPGSPGGLGVACGGDWECNSGPCITYEEFTYCTQTCGSCPTGYQCKPVDGQRVCVRKGLPGIGEPCTSTCVDGAICMGGEDAGGTCYKECVPGRGGRQCPGAEACVEIPVDGAASRGICLEAAERGMNCEDTEGVCVDGHVCVGGSDGSLCREECSPHGVDTCPGNERCMPLGQSGQVSGGACFPAGTREEGENCLSATDCVVGLVCVGGYSDATCMVECNPQAPDCPWPGQTCQPLEGGTGVCDPPLGGAETAGPSSEGSGSGTGASPGGTTAPGTGGEGSAPVFICECDATTICDAGCSCDPECPGAGGCLSSAAPLDAGSSANLWLFGLALGAVIVRRRRR